MTTPKSAQAFLDALKAEGVKVVEVGRWDTWNRNSVGSWGPVNGVMIHHTVSKGTANSVKYCREGSDELPGPLCHGVIDKIGTVHLIGYGRTNHAGGGDPDVLQAVINEDYTDHPPATHEHQGSAGAVDGNRHFYGFECINMGDGVDPWPAEQLDAIERTATAICRLYGWGPESVIGHLEWSDWKSDPRGFTMTGMRARIDARLKRSPNTEPEDDEGETMPITQAYLNEGEVGGPELEVGKWTGLRMAKDSAIAQGPRSFNVTAYVTVSGEPGTSIDGLFYDYSPSTKYESLDRPMHGGIIPASGELHVAFSRPTVLSDGEQLKLKIRADRAGTKVTYRFFRLLNA